MDGRNDFFGQFRGDTGKTVIGASVVLGFCEDFFRGGAASYEITVHTDVSTLENFCHGDLHPAAEPAQADSTSLGCFRSTTAMLSEIRIGENAFNLDDVVDVVGGHVAGEDSDGDGAAFGMMAWGVPLLGSEAGQEAQVGFA